MESNYMGGARKRRMIFDDEKETEGSFFNVNVNTGKRKRTMGSLNVKGTAILSKDGHRHSQVYRGVMELLARFGYASIEEVRYGFHLNLQQAFNRLTYLEKAGLIKRFDSRTRPESFFCLT